MQTAIAITLVLACAAYVVWKLAGPWFGKSTGCGCSSCPARDAAPAPKK